MIGLLDQLFARREAATVPSMDGVLRPNSALDQASIVATGQEPDNLVVLNGDLLFSSGKDILGIAAQSGAAAQPTPRFGFEAPVTALAVSPEGTLAVGLDGMGVRIVGGTFGGLSLDAIGGRQPIGPTALAFIDNNTLAVAIGSAENGPEEWQRDLMELRASGSVWKVDLRTKAAVCLADGLAFPNGLLIRGDRIVVAESWNHRLLSLALDGRKARPGVVLEDLPGYPGRLSAASDGGAWLAVFAPRSQLIEFTLRERAYCLRMLREIPRDCWIAPTFRSGRSYREPMQGGAVRVHGIFKPWAPTRSYGLAVRLDADLQPVQSFHSRADGGRHGVVSLAEWGGSIVFASRGADLVGSLPLDPIAFPEPAR